MEIFENYKTVCKQMVIIEKKGRVTWNHTVHELLVLNRNTRNNISVCKLFVLDRNTWYYITLCKQMIMDK